MHEYPPRPDDQMGVPEDEFDAEFHNSLHNLEQRLGIVALDDQVENPVSHSSEDIDSILDSAYDLNSAHDAVLDAGDAVYDEAATMNQEFEAKRAAELRQLIDEALVELQQAEDDAKDKEVAEKEAELEDEAGNRKAESKPDEADSKQPEKTPLIANPQYTKAVLTQAQVVEPVAAQTSVDSTNGDIIIAKTLDKNTLTIVHPQIGGEPKVINYNYDPASGELSIETNGVTTTASVSHEPTGDIRLGRKKIALPNSVAKMVGAEFVLAA